MLITDLITDLMAVIRQQVAPRGLDSRLAAAERWAWQWPQLARVLGGRHLALRL